MRIATRVLAVLLLAAAPAAAQQTPYEPVEGQSGKDVVWVPTPDALVERMLDMAAVTPQDFVVDLGSGDGRNIIAAARRGVRGLGVEYNEQMVEFARTRAAAAGVAERAEFMQGDMYEADISKATVLALFLLTENLDKLAPKFLDLKPGTRIVLNYFTASGWTPDRTESIQDCNVWCTAHLYIVPAKAGGVWRLGDATLTLRQDFQMLRGTLAQDGRALDITGGRLDGDRILFTAGGVRHEGRVEGAGMTGTRADGTSWAAQRVLPAD